MVVAALSDAELLDRARNGDEAAFTELYVRHHDAAQRLAGSYRRCGDPDDLVNGAFERVLAALRRGAGPTDSFRAYLFVTLRRLALEQARRQGDEPVDEVPEPVMAVIDGPELDSADREMIAEAFESLPVPWQAVLWQTAVEGRQPRDFAGSVGMSPNAAAALAYRARERLRQAYLQAHLRTKPQRGCEPHRSRLGGYVRGGLAHRHDAATRQHVEHCASCRELVDELSDVNRLLVRSIVPVFAVAGGATFAARAAGGAAAASASSLSSASSGGIGVFDAAVTGARRVGLAAGSAVAAAAAAVLLGVTLIPHDAGPGSTRAPDVQTGAPATGDESPELAARRDTTSTTAAEAPAPGPDGAGTGPGSTAGAESTTTGTSDTAGASGGEAAPSTGLQGEVEADVGAEIDAGPLDASVSGGVDVGVGVDGSGASASADVDLAANLGLDARWLDPLLGNGTLEMLVPNSGGQAAAGVELDIALSANAHVSTLQSGGCAGPGGGLLGTVLGIVQALTCTLGVVDPGATATTSMQVQVTAPGQTATVSLLRDGQLVTSRVIDLPMG